MSCLDSYLEDRHSVQNQRGPASMHLRLKQVFHLIFSSLPRGHAGETTGCLVVCVAFPEQVSQENIFS